jgi:antitoxin ParD1/3/4
MTITLTDDLERLVNEKVKSGAYKSADEVVAASLRLLKAQEEGMEALRREIMRGVEDIQEGRFSTYTNEDEIGAFSDRIIKQGQERLKASEKQ